MFEIRRTRLFLGALAAAGAVAAAPAGAQTSVTLSVGTALYSDDEFCLDSDAFITTYQAGVEGSTFGADAMYNNSDWPWPPRGPGGSGGGASEQGNYTSHGDAFTGLLKLFPLTAIARAGAAEGLTRIDRVLRPFVGVGLHVSTDGEYAPAGEGRELPTWGVRGQTRPLLAFGASLELPARDLPVGLIVTYRQNILFAGDFELDTGTGQDVVIDAENLNWGEVSVGLRFRVGQ